MSEQTAAGTQKKKHFTLPLFQRNVRYGEVDLPFFLIVIALLVIGIIMMFSASYAWAIAEGESGTYYATNQIKNALVGIVIMCILCMIDYHVFQKAYVAVLSYFIPLALLAVAFIPGLGVTDGGATRWIAIGSFNFQPSELMKIGIVIFFSYIIDKNQANMRSFRKGMLPLLIAMGAVAVLLIMEPHLSATILIVLISIILIFVGGADIKQLIALVFRWISVFSTSCISFPPIIAPCVQCITMFLNRPLDEFFHQFPAAPVPLLHSHGLSAKFVAFPFCPVRQVPPEPLLLRHVNL